MIKTASSRLRKFLVATLTLALAFTGLTAVSATAGGVTYAASNAVYDRNFRVSTSATNNEVVVPSGVNSMNFSYDFQLGTDFLTANVGKVISAEVKVFGPSGALQNGQNGSAAANPMNSMYFCDQSYLVCDSSDQTTSTIVVKNTHVHASVSSYVNVYNQSLGGARAADLAAGKYTITIKLFSGSTEIPQDSSSTGASPNNKYASYWVSGSSYTVGADVSNISANVGMCVDSSKLAVGDVLTPGLYLNDTAAQLANYDVSYYTRSSDAQNRRQMTDNHGATVTVTQDDIDYGLSVSAGAFRGSLTLGDAFAVQGSVTNQNGADVTGDCTPPAPSKPTLSVQGSMLSASVSAAKFSESSECAFFLATDLTTPVRTTFAMTMMPNTPATCSYTGATPGASYVVKVRGRYGMVTGAYSEPSTAVTMPVPGITISPAVSGGGDGGQVSLVSNSVASQVTANSLRVSADGKGGTFRVASFSTTPSCPPCGSTVTSYKVEQATNSGYNSGFAGTGIVEFSPVGSGGSATMAWYGSADKWTLAAATFTAGMTPSAQLEMVQGTYSSTTKTTTTVDQSVFTAACATLGSGYTSKSSANSTGIQIYPVSAPTAKQLFSLICWKPTTLADNTSVAYLANPVLVTIDNSTTVNVVKVLGENNGTTNSTGVVFSANPTAGAGDAALTALVTKRYVTAITMVNNIPTTTSTISGREIVRFTPALASTTTTSAWDTGNTSGSAEPPVVVPAVNDGSFYALLVGAMSNKLMKVPATGVATASVNITNDKSSEFVMPNYLWPIGLQSGSATDISLVITSATASAVLSVKTSTGAGKAAEIVKYSQSLGVGFTSQYVIDSASKDVYWWHSNSASAAGKISVYKWRDPLYVKPVAVPTVTAQVSGKATNTPAVGTKVTITGTNLDLVTSVTIGGNAATIGTRSSTSLEVTVPAGTTGTANVTIWYGMANSVSAGTFTYVGANKVAQTVALTSGANTAKVGDADRTLSATASMQGFTADQNITYSSSTPLVCTVTGTKLHFVAAGTCSIKATQAGSSWAAEGSASASITVSAAVSTTPTVTAQVSGKATNTPAVGTKVTIAGTNLGNVTAVKFGNVSATIGTRSATSLEVTVPNGATGTVNVTLVHSGGTVTAGTFTYVGATKLAQVVTLTSGANAALVGDADRTLSASVKIGADTATASLSYSSSTPLVCTVVGAKLHFVAAGTCTVKATQAASGWAAEGSATANITVKKPQTVTVAAPSAPEKLTGVEGIFIYAGSTSGGVLTYTFSTPTVCNKGTYVANHVLNLKAGTCTIQVAQAGDATWAAASSTLTYTVSAAGANPAALVDAGNVTSPVTLPNTGTKVNVLSEVVSWTKSTGALTISSRGIWVGPITATATFKVGTTNYTCSQSYGTLKGITDATATQVKGFPSLTGLCGGSSSTDKAALAALKGLKTTVTVKIVVARDLRNPANYATKGQSTTRTIYVNVG